MLTPGTRLGQYEIVDALGAGGMGEVYRGRDTRLNRSVAVKIISGEVAARPHLRERFEREAQVISQLNHPHICQLFDIGEATVARADPSGGGSSDEVVPYIVMEYLEGETLGDRLARGPLPLREVITIGTAIASALDRAHRHGVVHRDVKPANIMLTRMGAKLLDFGLARTTTFPMTAGDDGETFARSLTQEGTVVGTVHYMSPEQVRGEEIDSRSDIFSFGTVLYEMLSGRRPFTGRSAPEAMNAVAREDPPRLDEEYGVSSPIAKIVHRCLEKDSDARFQSAADLAFALQAIDSSTSRVMAVADAPQHAGSRRLLVSLIVVSAIAAIAAGVLLVRGPLRRGRPSSREVVRFTIPLAPGTSMDEWRYFALSPDGRTIAYVREPDRQINVRSLASLDERSLADSAGATGPFFSPDSEWIAYAAGGELRKTRLRDGRTIALANAGSLRGGSWGTNGTIVYSEGAFKSTLFKIPADGGEPKRITTTSATERETWHDMPQILPDGQTVLFRNVIGFGIDANYRIEALDLKSGKRVPVTEGASFRWTEDGWLLVTRQTRLLAVRFDRARLKTIGDPVPVLDSISPDVAFEVASNGTLLYWAVRPAVARILQTGRGEGPKPLALPPRDYGFLTLSPDQRQLSLTYRQKGVLRVGVAEVNGGSITELSPRARQGESHIGVWSADGERLIYSSNTPGQSANLLWQRADGTDQATRLTTSPNHQDPASVSRDGKWLAYAERTGEGWDIALLPLQGEHTPRIYLRTSASEFSPMISPDGRWLAYVSGESSESDDVYAPRTHVYIDTFPLPTRRIRVTPDDGGRDPLWTADGKRLLYRTRGDTYAADVEALPSLTAPAERLLDAAAVTQNPGFGAPNYALTADGSLVFIERTKNPAPMLIGVINWTAEFREIVESRR